MRQVTRFQSEDGTLFKEKCDAENRDEQTALVRLARGMLLSPEPEGCDFANGSGYFQISPTTYRLFVQTYRNAIKVWHPSLLELFDRNPGGIIGRYLGDSNSPFSTLHNLFCCIDPDKKLWGQQYYANNPEEGRQIKLGNV